MCCSARITRARPSNCAVKPSLRLASMPSPAPGNRCHRRHVFHRRMERLDVLHWAWMRSKRGGKIDAGLPVVLGQVLRACYVWFQCLCAARWRARPSSRLGCWGLAARRAFERRSHRQRWAGVCPSPCLISHDGTRLGDAGRPLVLKHPHHGGACLPSPLGSSAGVGVRHPSLDLPAMNFTKPPLWPGTLHAAGTRTL